MNTASLETLLTSYLASSTPGEASDRWTALDVHVGLHGWETNQQRDQIDIAAVRVRRRFTPDLMSSTVVNGDYGSETQVRIYSCLSLIGLRHLVRDMNPGSIEINSPYDCTGLVCGMGAKFIKIYRYGSYYMAVVEVSITRDV